MNPGISALTLLARCLSQYIYIYNLKFVNLKFLKMKKVKFLCACLSIALLLGCNDSSEDSDTALSHFRKYGWLSSKILVNKFTGDNEWATPSEYIESSRLVMGSIDLDPASNDYAQKTVKAIKYYTNKEDGLSKKWEGNIYLNPPYAVRVIDLFINKLYEDKVNQFILLTNNNTDTQWFSTAVGLSDLICFTKGRINFHKPDEISAPTNGQTFFYKGGNRKKFINEFNKYGIIMKVVNE